MEGTDETSDDALLVEASFFPQHPRVITLSKKMMFEVVAPQLNLVWKNTVVEEVTPHVFAAMVKVLSPPGAGGGQDEELVFHGDWLETVDGAIESAYAAALKYLKEQNRLVLINESYDELMRVRTELSAMRFWAEAFEQTTVAARREVLHLKATVRRLKENLVSACRRHAALLWISTGTEEASSGDPSSLPGASGVQYTGSSLPVTEIERLSASIVEIIQSPEDNG